MQTQLKKVQMFLKKGAARVLWQCPIKPCLPLHKAFLFQQTSVPSESSILATSPQLHKKARSSGGQTLTKVSLQNNSLANGNIFIFTLVLHFKIVLWLRPATITVL